MIRNFTANNESGKILIGRTGGVPVVVTAMTQFPNELVVQEQVGGVCNRQGNTGGLINSCLRPRMCCGGSGVPPFAAPSERHSLTTHSTMRRRALPTIQGCAFFRALAANNKPGKLLIAECTSSATCV